MEFVDWGILDGPGSGNHQEDQKLVKPGRYSHTRGTATGAGWDENVGSAIAMIKGRAGWIREQFQDGALQRLTDSKVFTDGIDDTPKRIIPTSRSITEQELVIKRIEVMRQTPVTQVNVIGWSRGAVTAHMFANAMAKDREVSRIPINIIAIDPVPGTGRFQENRTVIPENVESYVVFYARDERSQGFQPTLASVASTRTEVLYYPMPGRHATLSGNAGNYIGGNGTDTFYGPGIIVRALAETRLNFWGTTLSGSLGLPAVEMLRIYDEMIRQHEGYVALRDTVYTTRAGQEEDRSVGVGKNWLGTAFNKVDQLTSDGLFINWHHAELFQSVCAAAWRYFSNPQQRFMTNRVHAAMRTAPYTCAVLQHFRDTGERICPF
jgi:hypothetical protein